MLTTNNQSQQIAVVIPCYNQARFLGEAIESVINQTHTHVEIVVVDDGSTDHTPAVAARYPDVTYIRQENRGLASARNTGIRESLAHYLAFLDADDRLLPHALEIGLRHISAHPECAFVSGNYAFIDEDGSPLATGKTRQVSDDYFGALLQENIFGMHATVLYRRAALLSVGGFNSALPACEDYDLYLRLARTYPVHMYADVVAEYRQHSANMSGNVVLMLKTVQAVLHSNAQYLSTEEHIRAYQRGLTVWQNYYGQTLLKQIRKQAKNREILAATRGITQLARYAPRYLWQQLHQPHEWAMLTRIRDRLPLFLQRRLARWRKTAYLPPVGKVDFGDLYRKTPISSQFGFDRGLPIDRYYIEKFLIRHRHDIRGRVLEVGDRDYTEKFGGERVEISDVLHVDGQNPSATIVGDLTCAGHIRDNHFDCIILTQTLHLIYDVKAALQTVFRILKPGGTLLATVPGITQISHDRWSQTWYWAFTKLSIQRLLAATFQDGNIQVEAYGNVLAATAFLQGIATEEVDWRDLEESDHHYQLLIAIRATKAA